ncbi:MAG: hypothetical protein FJY66_03460, partial [Calditrichaeota bacterium]|nr:hypothetical protein [Calditrichota bacterium]
MMKTKASHLKTKKAESIEHRPSPTLLVGGLLLLVLALLVFLALASYDPLDWPMGPFHRPVSNWIGGVGAVIAWLLGPLLVGHWAAFGFVLLLAIWGWTLLRRNDWRRPLWLSLWVILLGLWTSATLGLACSLWAGWAEADYGDIAGLFGLWIAETGTYWFGITGLTIVLLTLFLAGLTLSVARFASWFQHRVDTTTERVRGLRGTISKRAVSKTTEALSDLEAEESVAGRKRALRKKLSAEKTKPTAELKTASVAGYVFPPIELFDSPSAEADVTITAQEIDENARLLEESLAQFGVSAKVVRVNPGPVITRYDLEPAAGVKISRIESLADDLALALRARGLRILAPIPGEAAVGIEIANPKPATVTFREIAESDAF